MICLLYCIPPPCQVILTKKLKNRAPQPLILRRSRRIPANARSIALILSVAEGSRQTGGTPRTRPAARPDPASSCSPRHSEKRRKNEVRTPDPKNLAGSVDSAARCFGTAFADCVHTPVLSMTPRGFSIHCAARYFGTALVDCVPLLFYFAPRTALVPRLVQ